MKEKLYWYALDTSAKIYPAIESIRNPTIFRVSMKLKDIVNENILLEALQNIKRRFPYYNVHIKNGLFWHYLEQNNNKLLVWHDTPTPCERIYPAFNNGYLYKVKFFDKTIALEISHVLTDGYGAMEFLKCLVNQYLYISAKISMQTSDIIDIKIKPSKDEYEDAFLNVIKKEKKKPNVEKDRTLFGSNKSYKIRSKLLSTGANKVITGIVSVKQIKVVSKKYNATITQLIAALYLEALMHLQSDQIKNKKEHKNISVQIPVNMRNYYDTKCMRNFSLFVIPFINPRKISKFEDIIKEVKTFMDKHLSHDYLLSMIHENCSLAKNKLLMHIPATIKNLVISYVTNTQGATQFTGTISNLGVVKLPDSLIKHVDNSLFYLGPSGHEKCSCGMLGYNGNIYMSFGKNMKDTYVEKHIFRRLVKMGVDVKLIGNL